MKKKLLCSHFVGSKQSLCDQRLLSGGEVLAEVVGEHFRNKKVILKRPRSRTALVYEIVGKSRDGTYLFRASNQRGKAAEDVFIEPSSCAAFTAPVNILKYPQGREYLEKHGLTAEKLANSTQICWATGGRLVPDEIWDKYMNTYM